MQLVRTVTDPLVSNLGHWRPATGSFEALPRGQFTVIKRLATGINGDIFQFRRTCVGQVREDVAVKKIRQDSLDSLQGTETDERSLHFRLHNRKAPNLEDALTEVGVLRYLANQADLPLYLLRLHGVFAQGSNTWLVTEFAEGGELFGEVQRQGRLPEERAQRYAWQVLQAVAYIHRHHIGHRDISLENILLKDGVARLMDFGMAVRSRTASGTALRYFRAVGKDFYRGPECYVPQSMTVDIIAPELAAPEAVIMAAIAGGAFHCEVRLPTKVVPGNPCKADVWGYAAEPADIFSVGVCTFMMLVGSPPWVKATVADGLFSYVHQNGLAALLREWRMPALTPAAMELIVGMTNLDPSCRPTANTCFKCGWLQDMCDQAVVLHSKDGDEPEVWAALAGA